MMKAICLSIAGTVMLAGAAQAQFAVVTTADEVIANSSDLFFGEAPFVAEDGTLRLDPTGEIKTPFLRAKVSWARTAKTVTPGELTGNWGGINVPVGTRFYAIRFKDGFDSQIKREEDAGARIPNVAWCTPDIKPEKNDPYCLFQSRLGMKLTAAKSGAGNAFYPEYMGIGSHGVFTEPVLEETPVTFERDLTLETEIRKISKSKVKFRVSLNDGDERSEIFSGEAPLGEDGVARIELWGGSIDIKPTGKKSFEAVMVDPIDPAKALDDERIIYPYSLRS